MSQLTRKKKLWKFKHFDKVIVLIDFQIQNIKSCKRNQIHARDRLSKVSNNLIKCIS